MLFQNAQTYNRKGYHVHIEYYEEKIPHSLRVSAVVSLFFLVSGLSHTIPFCSMFCLTDFEEWETVHSLPLFNPLNPKIKIKILLCCPYSFTTEVVGRSR